MCTEKLCYTKAQRMLAHTQREATQIQFSANGNADQSDALQYVRTNAEDYKSIGMCWKGKRRWIQSFFSNKLINITTVVYTTWPL